MNDYKLSGINIDDLEQAKLVHRQ